MADGPWTAYQQRGPWEAYQTQPAKKEQSKKWGDVAGEAFTNLPSSAVQFGKDIIRPVTHPVETGKGLLALGRGALDYTRDVPGGRTALDVLSPPLGLARRLSEATKGKDEDLRTPVRALGAHYAERYGGVEPLKRTLASDPVGALGDLSMIFSGGETALARAPGALGRVGRISGTLERATNPLTAPLAATKGLGTALSPTAARAGAEGGAGATAFTSQMRGKAPQIEAVQDARRAVTELKKQRGQAYLSEIGPILKDPTVLNFSEIDNAINRAAAIKTFKGQQLDPAVEKAWFVIKGMVDEWRDLPPRDFHTIEGMDALKRKIGNVRDATPRGTPERLAASQIYGAVRNTIINQAPEYAKVMKGYEEAQHQIKQIEMSLTGKPDASVETALRKLQSTLRHQVSPIYKNRKVLAEYLANAGAPTLMEKIAGQKHSMWMPGTLGKQMAAGDLTVALASIIFGHPSGLAAAALAPFASPRVRGEVAYALGSAGRPLDRARMPARAAVGVAGLERTERSKQQYGGSQE